MKSQSAKPLAFENSIHYQTLTLLQFAGMQLIGAVYNNCIYFVFGLARFFFGPTIFKGADGARSG